MLSASYLGRAPSKPLNHQSSWSGLRLLLAVSLFASSLVFMCYRASLTAELASRRNRLPFSRLEHLLESDYRVTSLSNLGLFLTLFESSDEDSGLSQLYYNYIEPYKDDYLFATNEEALADLMVTPRYTILHNRITAMTTLS